MANLVTIYINSILCWLYSSKGKQNKENSEEWHCFTLLDSRRDGRQPDTHVSRLTLFLSDVLSEELLSTSCFSSDTRLAEKYLIGLLRTGFSPAVLYTNEYLLLILSVKIIFQEKASRSAHALKLYSKSLCTKPRQSNPPKPQTANWSTKANSNNNTKTKGPDTSQICPE